MGEILKKGKKKMSKRENPCFPLPYTTLQSIKKIIVGYYVLKSNVSIEDVEKQTLQRRWKITTSSNFLAAFGIIIGTTNKEITGNGEKLGRALQLGDQEDIKKYWREIIEENAFFIELTAFLNSKGAIKEDEFIRYIWSEAKYRQPQDPVITGARAVKNILVEAGYASKSNGKYKVYKATSKISVDASLKYSPELIPFVKLFRNDHPDPSKCVFIMMQFKNTKHHNEIVDAIKSAFTIYNIKALRADDKSYSDDLLPNVRTYMHGCGLGIAIFERLTEDVFNPNVSLEVGYMMALGKPILLLKDSTLSKLHTDLVGRLYEIFDTQNSSQTIPPVIEKWLREKDLISS